MKPGTSVSAEIVNIFRSYHMIVVIIAINLFVLVYICFSNPFYKYVFCKKISNNQIDISYTVGQN